MLEGIPWAAIGGLTPAALLSIAVLLILTGKIVPKATYDSMVEQKNFWRNTCGTQQETIHVQAQTISKQEVASDSIVKIMTAVQEANRDSGGRP